MHLLQFVDDPDAILAFNVLHLCHRRHLGLEITLQEKDTAS